MRPPALIYLPLNGPALKSHSAISATLLAAALVAISNEGDSQTLVGTVAVTVQPDAQNVTGVPPLTLIEYSPEETYARATLYIVFAATATPELLQVSVLELFEQSMIVVSDKDGS